MNTLRNKACKACEGGVEPLSIERTQKLLKEVHKDWIINLDFKSISRQFTFINQDQSLAFINAVAWISHSENHHPDLSFECTIVVMTYTTHAIRGLSENDFICAAKIDALLEN